MRPTLVQPQSTTYGDDVTELDLLFGTPIFAVADPEGGFVYVY